MFSKNSDLPAKNKGGRPKGSKSPKTKSERLFDRLMNSRGAKLEKILDTVIAQAEQGDNACVRAIFERAFPARGRTVKLSLSSDPVKAVDTTASSPSTKNGKLCLLVPSVAGLDGTTAWDRRHPGHFIFFFENQWFDRCLRQA
jgi:hypothetical protein